MMRPPPSRDDLLLIVHEHNHVHNEHQRATSESVRRKLEARMLEIEERFARELMEAVADETLRRAWHQHLHWRAPAPAEPAPVSPLLFRGRSEVGSEVVAREGPRGELEVEVDGAVYDRGRRPDLATNGDGAVLRVGALPAFQETFELPAGALDALREWFERSGAVPPWRFGRALAAEGLVDHHFALTDRGRRALSFAATKPTTRPQGSRSLRT